MKGIQQFCISFVLLLCINFNLIYAQNPIVYPGDVNNNGVANNVDLLYIGSAFGETGASRTIYEVNSSVAVSGGTAPYLYQWDDGSSQAITSAFTALSGSYVNCVTITDAQGETCIVCDEYFVGDTIICNLAINTVTDASSGLASFSVNNPSDYTDFLWDLNGMTNISQNPTFQNLADGVYNICLTATDTQGNICNTCTSFTIGNTNNALNCTINIAVLEAISTSTTWGAQSITDPWNNFFTNNLNYAYADCDGNGQIDEIDITIVDSNYDLQQPTVSLDNFIAGNATSDPIFSFTPIIDTLQMAAGDLVEVPIVLGNSTLPIDNFYGTAFTVNYDTAFIKQGSVSIQFYLNSWINPDNSGLISIQKDKYSDGLIEAAISRKNQLPVNGFGEIGKVSFIIEDNLIGALQMDNTIDIEMAKTKVVDEFLNEQVVADGAIAIPIDTLTNIEFPLEKEIQVYPNPANEFLYIQHPNVAIEALELTSVSGSTYPLSIMTVGQTVQLQTNHIPAGIYILKIKTSNRIYNKKIIIQKK